ncbi:unnamed protein product [Symbiodinium sp. CCMP2592]|nr:unnamed protein product [Symbiodinium sp. CCMP2592]
MGSTAYHRDGMPSMRKNLHVATEPEEARQAALRLRALGLEPPRAHLFKKLAQAESARSSRKEQDVAGSPMFLSPQLREVCLACSLSCDLYLSSRGSRMHHEAEVDSYQKRCLTKVDEWWYLCIIVASETKKNVEPVL